MGLLSRISKDDSEAPLCWAAVDLPPKTRGPCVAVVVFLLIGSAIVAVSAVLLTARKTSLQNVLGRKGLPGNITEAHHHSGVGSLRSLDGDSVMGTPLHGEQKIYIVRHGDEFSSYRSCMFLQDPFQLSPCYSKATMGNNPPLTGCGLEQAEVLAKRVIHDARHMGGLKHVVTSPLLRAIQTALPLAKKAGLTLKVEYLVSEARQPEGPFRPFNTEAGPNATSQMPEVKSLWERGYGSPPIATPENDTQYNLRIQEAAKDLRARFPVSAGSYAIITHATTAFSLAYGLCGSEMFKDAKDGLQDFVTQQRGIAPAGVISITLDAYGACTGIGQTDNGVYHGAGCGSTDIYKCEYEDFPAWYWFDPKGRGPGRCQ